MLKMRCVVQDRYPGSAGGGYTGSTTRVQLAANRLLEVRVKIEMCIRGEAVLKENIEQLTHHTEVRDSEVRRLSRIILGKKDELHQIQVGLIHLRYEEKALQELLVI